MKFRHAALASWMFPLMAFAFSPILPRRSTALLVPKVSKSTFSSGPLFSFRQDDPALGAVLPIPLYGGDYAGLSATFSSSSGNLIPVPDHLVPESLLEWGQVPAFLEVLTSEESKRDSDITLLERQTVVVLPDVGCGVDNLETTKSRENIQLNLNGNSPDGHLAILADDVVALEYALPPLRDMGRKRVETTFGLDNSQRIRTFFDLLCSGDNCEIQSPITIVVERQTSPKSSGGTIADGGGLDGRTVSRLIGNDILNQPFTELEPFKPKQLMGYQKKDHDDSMEGSRLLENGLFLSGNITIVYSSEESPARLDVVHVTNDLNTRRVVRRYFDPNGNLVGNAKHWIEQKEIQNEHKA